MKRMLAALLAALMLLSLAACKKDETPVEPEEPEITEPQEPETTEPEEEVPEEPDEPAEPDEGTADPEPTAPVEGAAAVEDLVTEGLVEEAISYRITVPKISTGSADADQILSDYYTSAAGKVEDLCWGELYEEALTDQAMYHVEADYVVERNDGEVLSIRRTVTVTDLGTSKARVTLYAETFSLPGGGLMTASDFFTADPTDRLVEQVRRSISEDPYHDQNYYPQWSDLCRSAFNKDQFYVTDGFYVVFYQEGDLGQGGRTVFEIPWDSLKDIAR